MIDDPFFPDEAGDPWTIPLHGIVVPLPPTADVPLTAEPTASEPPPADAPPVEFLSDEVPTDEGYHPRLRRSA